MSMGFLVEEKSAIVWRGLMVRHLITSNKLDLKFIFLH